MGAILSQTNSRFVVLYLMTCMACTVIDMGEPMSPLFPPIVCVTLLFVTLYICMGTRPNPIYLIESECFRPPAPCRVPFATFVEQVHTIFEHKPELGNFFMQVLQRSGLGEETVLPPGNQYIPPRRTMIGAEEEFRMVIFTIVDSLFAKTAIRPDQIDAVVANCSAFAPTPSLTAKLINRYKMRDDIKSYNLSGMGCSAEMISLDLAKNILQVHPNSYALIISTEIMTPYSYVGESRAMMVSNALFRVGGVAMIVSNRPDEQARSKYQLMHLIRTHMGAEERAYQCVHQQEDPQGVMGFALDRNLPAIAGEVLKANITVLAPLVLPMSEQLYFILNYMQRRFLNKGLKPYMPNFKLAFEHFCIHAGGRAVIDNVQKSLQLTQEDAEASRMTLYRFGNTSSSSPWYSLAYTEAKGRMKKGDRVWQIALGSGFKVNSAVWKCLRNISAVTDGVWSDCIDQFPTEVVIPSA